MGNMVELPSKYSITPIDEDDVNEIRGLLSPSPTVPHLDPDNYEPNHRTPEAAAAMIPSSLIHLCYGGESQSPLRY